MRIAVLAFDGISVFHLAAPVLVFGEVERLHPGERWQVTTWSEGSGSIRSADGLLIGDLAGPECLEGVDLLVLPSWPTDLPEPSAALVAMIRAVHRRGAVVAGLCLGAFPLASSGLLDGRTAATHWAAATSLAERHPQVDVEPDALYVDLGDVLTSAGTASTLDACLHIVRTRLGSEVAKTVARHLVIAPHREGDQAQYIDRPMPDRETGPLADTLGWALQNLDQPLHVDDLAARASMSRRNFARRFQETTGTTPARWVLTRRLDEARRLLEVTEWPVSRVAAACGFASVVTFRQNFVARYATTPTSYRLRFAGSGQWS